MSTAEDVRSLVAAQQWEITKGHLHACYALLSAKRQTDPREGYESVQAKKRSDEFRRSIEAFIQLVEDYGYCE